MRISRQIHDELLVHAREEAPNECCGLIGGSDGVAKTVYRARNAEASPLRYNLDPQDQFRIMSEMDEKGEEPSAIYHSHTASPAWEKGRDEPDLLGDEAGDLTEPPRREGVVFY